MATEKPDRDLTLTAEAIEAFLASPRCAGPGNTYRAYAGVLSRLAGQLGAHRALADVARYTRPGLAAVTNATALLDPPQRHG
ncbi:MAG: hypothetical protein ACXV3F_08510 [Frankiaceae bacterium]